jgi:hypothetical protein
MTAEMVADLSLFVLALLVGFEVISRSRRRCTRR